MFEELIFRYVLINRIPVTANRIFIVRVIISGISFAIVHLTWDFGISSLKSPATSSRGYKLYLSVLTQHIPYFVHNTRSRKDNFNAFMEEIRLCFDEEDENELTVKVKREYDELLTTFQYERNQMNHIF